MNIKQLVVAAIAGSLFGYGLAISHMIDRHVVLNFLDIFGTWDPRLIFVMGGAVMVTLVAFRFVLRMKSPLVASEFKLPTSSLIDGKLITGAGFFGIGWGISGYCPGPALSALTLFNANTVLFFVAFVTGALLADHLPMWKKEVKNPS